MSGQIINHPPSIINDYRLIASTGQASMQAPQSMQESGSMAALPSTMLIALLGHSSTQDSQPVHLPLSTSAGIQLSFQERLRLSLKTTES
jgi:hypothetical protein